MKNFLAAPIFETAEQTHTARVAHTISLTLVVAGVAVFLAHMWFWDLALILACVIAMAGLLLAFYFLHRGHLVPVCFVLPLILLVFLSHQAYNGNGLHDLSVMGFPLVIVLAGLLLGKSAPIGFGALCFAVLTGLYLAEVRGILRTPFSAVTDAADLVSIAAILGITAVLLRMLIGHLTHSLNLAQEHKNAVAQTNHQLENQNAELERFTYTVSHDLRSPLVTIRGFAGFAAKDARGGQTERLMEDLEQINQAAKKMDRLLTDLLELSRVGRIIHTSEQIPFQELANEAIGLVAGGIVQRGVRVEVAPDVPALFGDRLRLLEVFQNLIDNAVKFIGDTSDPWVKIDGHREGEFNVYRVRDNGMGIEASHRERIFGLFERLEPSIDGTGIGLALVKRIIEHHGGQIAVESEGLGRGSTFRLSLPAGLA